MARRHIEKALGVLVHGAVDTVLRKHRTRAQKAHDNSRHWVRAPGVVGFGVAERIKRGQKQKSLTLKVYVARKLPLSEVNHPVPRKLRVPGLSEPIETDVEEIGELRPQSFTHRERPATPGVSLSHPQCGPGTFGALVRKRGRSDLFILSNSHVIADNSRAQQGDAVLQPSQEHGGTADDEIAVFEEAVPLLFSEEGFPNTADAAIARVSRARDVGAAVKLIGIPKGISTDLGPGILVQKTGSVTGHTVGVIKATHFSAEIKYKRGPGDAARVGFRDCVLCTRFTDEGDSGALVLNMDGEAVGLHFAGSDSTSVFARIDTVLEALDIELVTQKV
jgi:hypothetical protein